MKGTECSTCRLLVDALQASGGEKLRAITITLEGEERGIIESKDGMYIAQLYCTTGTH
jgi:hypothetical protein